MWVLAGILFGFMAVLGLLGWGVWVWGGAWGLGLFVLWVLGGFAGSLWAHTRSAYLLRLSRQRWGWRNWVLVVLAGPIMWLILVMIYLVFAAP